MTPEESRAARPPRALILDLGNVLIFHDNDRLFRELGAACGCTADEVQIRMRLSGAARRINIEDGSPRSTWQIVAPAIGFRGTFEQFAAIWNGIFTPYEAMAGPVAALAGRLPLYVLSNTNPLHMAYIREVLPLLGRFDAVLTSYELGAAKPDAAIYRRALAVAGVAAHEAAFFDDLPGHVEGAARAGLRGILFTDVERFERDLAGLGLVPPRPFAGE